MEQASKVTALVMAGKRSGLLDPLAAKAGVSQKAVVPVAGVPMVERVVRAVAQCEQIGAIRLVAHEPDEIAALPAVAALMKEGRLSFAEGKFNIVDSVFSGAEGIDFPMIITTADNCLVTAKGYSEFIAKCIDAKAGAAAALARKEDVLAVDPVGQKRFYQFSDGAFSNCNLYWMAEPASSQFSRNHARRWPVREVPEPDHKGLWLYEPRPLSPGDRLEGQAV